MRTLHRLATTCEAFVETVEAPYVSRMLVRARQGGIKSEISAIDLLRLIGEPRIHQQCAEGMARGLHPSPRLIVKEVVVECDGTAQMREPLFDLPRLVVQFAKHHLLGHFEDFRTRIVKHHPFRLYRVAGTGEKRRTPSRLVETPEIHQCDGARVVQ